MRTLPLLAIAAVLAASLTACTKTHVRRIPLQTFPVTAVPPTPPSGFLLPAQTTFKIAETPEGSLFRLVKVNDQFEIVGDLPLQFTNAFHYMIAKQQGGVLAAVTAPAGAPWNASGVADGQFIVQPTITNVTITNVLRKDGLNVVPGEMSLSMRVDYAVYAPGVPKPVAEFHFISGPALSTKRDASPAMSAVIWTAAQLGSLCLEGKYPEWWKPEWGGVCKEVAAAIAGLKTNATAKIESKLAPLEAAGDHAGLLLALSEAYRAAGPATEDALFTRIAATVKKLPARPPLSEEGRRHAVPAQAAVQAKNYDEAIRLFGEANRQCPWWPDGYYNRALLLGERSRIPEAIVAMKRFLALAPESPDARRAQDKIYEWEAKPK